jgi:hypothetical protein
LGALNRSSAYLWDYATIASLATTVIPANSLAPVEIDEAISARIGTLARVLSGTLCFAGTITFVPFTDVGGS